MNLNFLFIKNDNFEMVKGEKKNKLIVVKLVRFLSRISDLLVGHTISNQHDGLVAICTHGIILMTFPQQFKSHG